MAHPYAEHREHHASKRRVGKVMRSGGEAHSDAAADKKLFSNLMHEHEMKMHGTPGKRRLDKYARGGRTKGHKTNVNVIVAPQHGGGGGPGGAPTPMPVPRAPMAPPPGPPGGGPPGIGTMPGGPPMPPPGMPSRAAGGRIREQEPATLTEHEQRKFLGRKFGGRAGPGGGESTKENLGQWAAYASRNTKMASGGAVMAPRDESTKPGYHGPRNIASPRGTKPIKPSKAWSQRQGGTAKTEKLEKITLQKRAGEGSGEGLLRVARHTSGKYP